jgi:hypothetical protein
MTPCHLCGITGVHACPGSPIVWTETDARRLHKALADVFGWPAIGSPATMVAAVGLSGSGHEEQADQVTQEQGRTAKGDS